MLNLRFRIFKHTEGVWVPPVSSIFQAAGAQHVQVPFLRMSPAAHSECVVTSASVCLSLLVVLRIDFLNCLRHRCFGGDFPVDESAI